MTDLSFWTEKLLIIQAHPYSFRTNLNYRNKSLSDQIPAGE